MQSGDQADGGRDALRAALAEDRIDIVATDHAPHTREEKAGSYLEAPSGLPLVQHALLMLFDLFPVTTIVQKAAHAPALRFEVRERGFLREGIGRTWCWWIRMGGPWWTMSRCSTSAGGRRSRG